MKRLKDILPPYDIITGHTDIIDENPCVDFETNIVLEGKYKGQKVHVKRVNCTMDTCQETFRKHVFYYPKALYHYNIQLQEVNYGKKVMDSIFRKYQCNLTRSKLCTIFFVGLVICFAVCWYMIMCYFCNPVSIVWHIIYFLLGLVHSICVVNLYCVGWSGMEYVFTNKR